MFYSRLFVFFYICYCNCKQYDTDVQRTSLTIAKVPSYESFFSVTLVNIDVPVGTIQVELTLTATKNSASCDDTNVTLHLSYGALPLVNPNNESFPPSFNTHRATHPLTFQLPLTSTGRAVQRYMIEDMLPGTWYGGVYRSSEGNHIQQQGLSLNCEYTLNVVVATKAIIYVPEIGERHVTIVVIPSQSLSIRRFQIPPSTWQYEVHVMSCNQFSNQDSCSLKVGAQSSLIPLSTTRNCTDNCSILVSNPMTSHLQYVALRNDGEENITVELQVATNVCEMYRKNKSIDGCLFVGELNRGYNVSMDSQVTFSVYTDLSLVLPNILYLNDNFTTMARFQIRGGVDSGSTLHTKFFLPENLTESKKNFIVTACLFPRSTPFNGSEATCPDPISLNSTHNISEMFIPYPESGYWFMTVDTQCYIKKDSSISFVPCGDIVVVGFVLHLAMCVDGKCDNGGACYHRFGGNIIYSSCDCKAGWRGYGCTDDTNAYSTALQLTTVLMLTLSNLMFLPAIVVSAYRGYYMEAVVYTFTMFFSTFYHACDVDIAKRLCIMPISVLSFCDFYGSLLSFWVTIIAMSKLPPYLNAPATMLGPLGIAIGTRYDKHSLLAFLIPVLVSGMILIATWSVQCHKRKSCYPSKKRWLMFIVPGILFAGVGLILYAFVETEDNYYIVHSVWHVLISTCIVFLLPPKLKSSPLHTADCCREMNEHDVDQLLASSSMGPH